MSSIFAPTPCDESFKRLRVVPRGHGQFGIGNGDGFAHGEFDRQYVELSGYCGPHNPWTFAAAPELLAIAERILDRGYVSKHIGEERDDHMQLVAAIAKARGLAA